MRLHVRRLFYHILLLTVFFGLSFHLYIHLIQNSNTHNEAHAKPWGRDFDLPRTLPALKFVDKKFHDHVLRVPKAKKYSLEKNSSNNQLEEPKYYNSIMQMRIMTDPAKGTRVWPDRNFDWDDRIVAQMKYIPKAVKEEQQKPFDQQKTKLIIVWNGLGNRKKGRQSLVDDKCPVTQCYLTGDRSKVREADVLLFQHSVANPGHRRPHNQIWATYFLESPYHSPSLHQLRNIVNWTATYRHDSTIVTPYERFVPFNDSVVLKKPIRNYAFGKTKKVAWFVSNCGARNKRKEYAMQLQKHIDVHIYGACGTYKCPRYLSHKCFDMLNKDYKFYLSFENSNCRDYITEKFFDTGLLHDIIPIVMGAHPDDYKRAAPPNSFIHVDDFESPKALAGYLQKLDQNDNLYNEYFRWKGTGSFVNTLFWCRFCAMAWDDTKTTYYKDVNSWWRGDGVCIGANRWQPATYGKLWT